MEVVKLLSEKKLVQGKYEDQTCEHYSRKAFNGLKH